MDLGFVGVVYCLKEEKGLNEHVHHEFIKMGGKLYKMIFPSKQSFMQRIMLITFKADH